MRIRADIWTAAVIRRAQSAGAFAAIARKGHPEGGVILVKLNLLNGMAIVLTPMTAMDGTRQWLRGTGPNPVPDGVAEDYLGRQIARDPDCWVLEIEDRQGRWFFDEPVS
ncbi:MAG TPA: DUF1491 domain-containing protein [Alphaproteobacteria bacterium]|nr:DUF1491 domain-containing protein [Alphaproteobacteria bacterium]HAJ45048.1 DUF1491 domain-containing protein [Alphaproteobacteria bacterium]